MTGYIYRMYDCRNGMSYIGQSIDLERRIYNHILNISHGVNTKVYNYFKDVPQEHIKFEVLCKCDQSELNYFEQMYIDLYDTYNSGLNSTIGGHASAKANYKEWEDIRKDYLSGMSVSSIMIKYKISQTTVRKVLIRGGINLRDKPEVTTEYCNKSKKILCYDIRGNIQYKFKSIREAIGWLRSGEKPNIDDRNAYYTLRVAAKTFKIAYNHRWAYVEDLTYDKKHFNSILDIEGYKLGLKVVENELGLLVAYENNGNRYIESKIGSGDNKHRRECKHCGKPIDTKNISGLCLECYNKCGRNAFGGYADKQVPPELNVKLPFTREGLEELYPRYSISSIARHCNVSFSTVKYWLKRFGLK